MASFNNFQLLNDYLVLNYISCFQQNINTVRRKHIISIERTKIYSVPWMVVGLILSIYGLSVNISLLISGIVILVYQAISMFITVILIRVPGYTYSSRYCGSSDYDAIINWFHFQPMQSPNQPILSQVSS